MEETTSTKKECRQLEHKNAWLPPFFTPQAICTKECYSAVKNSLFQQEFPIHFLFRSGNREQGIKALVICKLVNVHKMKLPIC